MDAHLTAARAALHMWEEPCLSENGGSGAVFFSGCPLGCVFCQNAPISSGGAGQKIESERLAQIFLELQEQGANNINLVTAGHFLPHVVEALQLAKARGLVLPIVYNSSGYERVESLRLLEGLVDIYLPDCKYMDPELARRYSRAADYPQAARAAVEEMVRQAGEPRIDADGHMVGGVIVRILLLPGHVRDANAVLDYLYGTYGDRIYVSLMSQYTPTPAVAGDPLLHRRVTRREYERFVQHALDLGITQAYIQEREVAAESFIPAFDGTGVLG